MMSTETTQDFWAILEAAPDYVSSTAYLVSWSMNYDSIQAPFPVFLDLIGYNQERMGCKGSAWGVTDCDGLDYMGAHTLAKAMMEWADRPHEVEAWLDLLLSAEEQ